MQQSSLSLDICTVSSGAVADILKSWWCRVRILTFEKLILIDRLLILIATSIFGLTLLRLMVLLQRRITCASRTWLMSLSSDQKATKLYLKVERCGEHSAGSPLDYVTRSKTVYYDYCNNLLRSLCYACLGPFTWNNTNPTINSYERMHRA